MDPAEMADLITDELRAVARPERVAQEKAYLKSDLEFLGASVWEIRRVVQAARRSAGFCARLESGDKQRSWRGWGRGRTGPAG